MRTIRTPRNSLRKNNLSMPSGKPRDSELSVIDKFLQRLAHVSQPGLLALGIFGYFYTVVPVFQNQQLQEQTAKLELEKAASERQLASLTARQAKVKDDIRLLQEKWAYEKNRSTQLAGAVSLANNRESDARRQVAETSAVLQRQLSLLDTARWELVLLDFSLAHYVTRYNSTIRSFNTGNGKEPGEFISAEAAEWPKPYESMLYAVDVAATKGRERRDIPEGYYKELREFISSKENALKCERPNFDAIRSNYLAEVASLEHVIDAELDRYIEGIRKEYAAKAQRVEITEDFRLKSRRTIQIGKVFTVDKSYRDKISALRKACDERADRVLTEIRNAKGATG